MSKINVICDVCGKEFKIKRLEENYGEDGSGAGSDYNFDATISWSPGKSSVEPVEPSS